MDINDSEFLHPAVESAWARSFGGPPAASSDLLEAVADRHGVDRTAALLGFLDAIEAATGVAIPPTLLHRARTPEALGALLRSGEIPAHTRPVLVRPGIGRAIFVIPGAGGTGFDLQELLDRLRWDGPVYMLMAPGVDPREPPQPTLAGRMEDALALIRGVEPHGPHLLVGYSLGGVIAIEAARRLAATGDPPGLVLALDPQLEEANWTFRAYLSFARNRAAHHARQFLARSPREAARYAAGRLLPVAGRLLRTFGVARPFGWTPYDQQGGLPPAVEALWNNDLAAGNGFRMTRYEGGVVLVFSRRGDAALADPERLWRRFLPAMEVRWLEGNHLEIMQPPLVDELVGVIAREAVGAAG